MDYASYTDESYSTGERYRSICAFSFPMGSESAIRSRLTADLQSSKVTEAKWNKVRNLNQQSCAISLVDTAFHSLRHFNARIDVLVWDTHDSRHSIPGRDDKANFERMFFHLLGYSMKRRPRGAHWRIYPDEQMGVAWQTIKDCLSAVGRRSQLIHYPLLGPFLADPHYRILELEEIRSHEHPPCQVADLFAGLAVFSRVRFPEYLQWCERNGPQCKLFLPVQSDEPGFSRKEMYRFPVLEHFNSRCKAERLGVSLRTNKGLCTKDPMKPFNFWLYVPQHEMDRAPVRSGRPLRE